MAQFPPCWNKQFLIPNKPILFGFIHFLLVNNLSCWYNEMFSPFSAIPWFFITIWPVKNSGELNTYFCVTLVIPKNGIIQKWVLIFFWQTEYSFKLKEIICMPFGERRERTTYCTLKVLKLWPLKMKTGRLSSKKRTDMHIFFPY